mgnify:CR=1 FL=1
MNERGEVILCALLVLVALGLGYLGAQVEMQREACPKSHQAGCLFGEVNDGLVPSLSTLWLVSGETGAVGGLVVSEREMQLAAEGVK